MYQDPHHYERFQETPPPLSVPVYSVQKKKNWGCIAMYIAIGFVLASLFLCIASFHNNSQPSAQQSVIPQKHFTVGETVSNIDNTWNITVDSVTETQGSAFELPKSGDTYLLITMTFKNISSEQQDVSSLLNLQVKGSDGSIEEQTFISGYTAPDGKVTAGDMIKGTLVYEVPQNTKHFTLDYSSLLGQVYTWDLSL